MIANASGSGVTSDTARKHVDEILNAAQTDEQVQAVLDVIHKDSGYAHKGLHDTISELSRSISGKSPAPSNADMIKVINPQGQVGSIPKDKLAGALKAGFKQAP